jgi:PAS domain S-box-containing protein
MKSSDLVTPQDRDRIEKTVINIRPDSEPEALTIRVKRKDGSIRCILSRISAAIFDDSITTYITMTDITESTEREQALRDRIAALQKSVD